MKKTEKMLLRAFFSEITGVRIDHVQAVVFHMIKEFQFLVCQAEVKYLNAVFQLLQILSLT